MTLPSKKPQDIGTLNHGSNESVGNWVNMVLIMSFPVFVQFSSMNSGCYHMIHVTLGFTSSFTALVV